MRVCNFESLNQVTLECAKKSIRQVIRDGIGVTQHSNFFNKTRKSAMADDRLIKLLEIVRGSGWSMNREGQCAHIINDIKSRTISRDELECFWKAVDGLPDIELRDLPNASNEHITGIERSLDEIRETLRGWHSSAATLCFLTKVVLMFNWGQTPAFDKRIRDVMKVKTHLTNKELVIALIEIGEWIQRAESRFGVRLDKLVSDEMKMQRKENLNPLPLGRCFDMMLYYQ